MAVFWNCVHHLETSLIPNNLDPETKDTECIWAKRKKKRCYILGKKHTAEREIQPLKESSTVCVPRSPQITISGTSSIVRTLLSHNVPKSRCLRDTKDHIRFLGKRRRVPRYFRVCKGREGWNEFEFVVSYCVVEVAFDNSPGLLLNTLLESLSSPFVV